MKHSLDIVDELFSKLNELKPLKAEDQNRLDKKFRLEFNYNSNHIEGNTLTYGETALLLIFGDTTGNHNIREYEETQAHDIAYHMVEEWAKDKERGLTEQDIKQLNKVILVRPFWKEAITPDGQNTRRQIKVGDYKEYPNSVRLQNGEIFEYASPVDTPILMSELIDWYRKAQEELHPVELAAMFHYKFVRIHPFDDGNGRISRLLMNYVLLKHSYPPVIIKSADKSNYLKALHFADIGDYAPFISYIAEQSIWSLQTSIKAAKSESLEDADDFIKEIELIKRKASLKGIPKSPKIVYSTFRDVNDTLWKSILNTLQHFDTLFNESKNVHTVNNLDENYGTTTVRAIDNILPHLLKTTEVSNGPRKLKIFGYDVYEDEIRIVEWDHKMFGLRGSDTHNDFSVHLEAIFDKHKYYIKLSATIRNGMFPYLEQIYNIEKSYEDFLLTFEIDDVNNALKMHLLENIKKEIN